MEILTPIINVIISGVILGSLYAVMSMGLTLIFGVMKVINFAHGSFLMAGMFATYYLNQLTGLDPYIGMVVTLPVLFAFGYFIQQVLIRPVFIIERDVREPIGVLLLTAGLWIFMDNLALALFGAFYKTIKTPYKGAVIYLGEVIISIPRLYAFLTTIVVSYHLLWLHPNQGGRSTATIGRNRRTTPPILTQPTLRESRLANLLSHIARRVYRPLSQQLPVRHLRKTMQTCAA